MIWDLAHWREGLLSNNDNANLAGALASAVIVNEEDAGQAVHLELAVGNLEGLVATDDGGAQVGVAVPEHGAVATRQVGRRARPGLDLLEVIQARVAVGAPVVLLGEDLVQAVREVGLEEGVTRRGGVVVILLGEDRTRWCERR